MKKNNNKVKNNPCVTIITVCFDSERHIEETIQSVINQDYSNIEYIIIDGGSTDNTLNIIKKYEKNISKWISEPDNGIYDAMNKGIDMASGDLIAFLNSDDYYYQRAIKKIVEKYKQTNADVVIGKVNVISQKNKKIFETNINYENLKKERFKIVHPSTFCKTGLLKKYKFNTKYQIKSDYDLLIKLFINNYNFVNLDYTTTAFRVGGTSNSLKTIIEDFKIKYKYLGLIKTFKYHFKNTVINLIRIIRNKVFHKILGDEKFTLIRKKWLKFKGKN
jgi:glycosyltransferase involved in cell wall biosynthesis